MKKNDRRLKVIIISVAVFIIFCLALFGAYKIIVPRVKNAALMTKNVFNISTESIAKGMNRNLPKTINKEIRQDPVEALSEKAIRFNFTLLSYSKEEVNMLELRDVLKQMLLDKVKTEPSLKLFRDNEITLIYKYNDKNDQEAFILEFTPEDYK